MQVLDWLSRLIEIDTTSRLSNLKCIEMLDSWFQEKGISTRITHAPVEKKANLLASLPGKNGALEGGLVLSGHTDTVPVDGQNWNTNPFQAVVKDGLVYGRGACDMKGFLAAALSLVSEWQQHKPEQPVHLAFSYDEEVGCKGAPHMIADFAAAGIKPKACIVGEPTLMKPVIAHKGIQVFRCRIKGVAAHSSLTTYGCNAIEYGAKVINYIRGMAERMRKDGPFDKHYDVPFTTLTTNFITGGSAYNIIPAECEFVFEFRHLPEVDPDKLSETIKKYVQDEIFPQMKKEHVEADISVERFGAVPSFQASNEAFNQLVCKISGEKETSKVAYATEAGLFQKAAIPTIVCGPGSIEQAHRANEFVAIEQLEKCQVFLQRLVNENMSS